MSSSIHSGDRASLGFSSGSLPSRTQFPLRAQSLPTRRLVLRTAAGAAAGWLAGFLPGCAPAQPRYDSSDSYLELDDETKVFVKELLPPEGEPEVTVIFAHGLGGDSGEWSNFIPSAQARILAFDAPAHGQSDSYHSGIHSPERNALIVEKLVATADPNLPVVLAGYSMGGMTMASFAGRHPEFEGCIVMINSHASPLHTGLVDVALALLSNPNLALDSRQGMLEYVQNIQTFDVLAALAQSRAHWIVIGSRYDEIIPFASVKALADLLGAKATFIALDGRHAPGILGSIAIQKAIGDELSALCGE